MDWVAKGTAALENTDGAAEAVVHFTRALIQHPTSPDYFSQRATALSRLKPPRHDLALRDAEYAVLLGRQRAKREKMQIGQHRRMVALYGLGRYEDARSVLVSMQRWRPKDSKKDKMENDIWMAKIEGKLKGKDISVASQSIDELPQVELPSEKAMTAWLRSQIKTDDTFDYDGHSSRAADVQSSTGQMQDRPTGNSNGTENSAITSVPIEVAAQPIRHDFYQNTNNVIVSFYAKKVNPSTVNCKIESDSFDLSFPHPDDLSSTFTYSAHPSFGKIDTANSKFKVMGTKIELTLAKVDKGLQWKVLQGSSSSSLEPQSNQERKLPSPYVSKQPDTDWDKKAAELTKKKPKKDKKPNQGDEAEAGADGNDNDKDESDGDGYESDYDGGDAVDGFFKKLYAGADPDTRKAMMKSFTESNGTALSTNWSEVSKGKVEEVKPKSDNDD